MWGFHFVEFLSQNCVKAGHPSDNWLDEDIEVQHFQAQIFTEVAPGRYSKRASWRARRGRVGLDK